jgi:hypothetical protein
MFESCESSIEGKALLTYLQSFMPVSLRNFARNRIMCKDTRCCLIDDRALDVSCRLFISVLRSICQTIEVLYMTVISRGLLKKEEERE